MRLWLSWMPSEIDCAQPVPKYAALGSPCS